MKGYCVAIFPAAENLVVEYLCFFGGDLALPQVC